MTDFPEIRGVRVKYSKPFGEAVSPKSGFTVSSGVFESNDVASIIKRFFDGSLKTLDTPQCNFPVYNHEGKYCAIAMDIVEGGTILVCVMTISYISVQDDDINEEKVCRLLKDGLDLGMDKLYTTEKLTK